MKALFVGNLPFSMAEADLRSLFEQFGGVERVNLVTERDTGKSRGFGFVEMSDEESAGQAIAALDGHPFQGRALHVSEARPKADHSPSRGERGHRRQLRERHL